VYFYCKILGKRKGKIQRSDVLELVVLLKHRKQNQREKTIFFVSSLFSMLLILVHFCHRRSYANLLLEAILLA